MTGGQPAEHRIGAGLVCNAQVKDSAALQRLVGQLPAVTAGPSCTPWALSWGIWRLNDDVVGTQM